MGQVRAVRVEQLCIPLSSRCAGVIWGVGTADYASARLLPQKEPSRILYSGHFVDYRESRKHTFRSRLRVGINFRKKGTQNEKQNGRNA